MSVLRMRAEAAIAASLARGSLTWSTPCTMGTATTSTICSSQSRTGATWSSLTWDTCQFWGREADPGSDVRPCEIGGVRNVRLDDDRSAPRMAEFLGEPVIEVFFAFDTGSRHRQGFRSADPGRVGPARLRALMIATGLVALDCAPEPVGRHPRLGFEPGLSGPDLGRVGRGEIGLLAA